MKTIEAVIAQHKDAILKQWTEATIRTYPAETVPFFLREKDRFANPVAGLLTESLEKVVKGMAGQASDQELAESLDAAIRVRAVQNFTPSQAVGFIFLLKEIFRSIVDADEAFFSLLDRKVDELVLIGFNKYVACREKIFALKAYEVRNRTFKAFERAGLVKDA
jgi:hypothetical protein